MLALLPVCSLQVVGAVLAVFGVDYLLFGRRQWRAGLWGWAVLVLPTVVTTVSILLTWNPGVILAEQRWLGEHWYTRLIMLWWIVRDLNAAQMGVGALVLAAPLVGLATGRRWLVRPGVAAGVGCVLEALVTPQLPPLTYQAEVRHLVWILPVTLAMGVGVLDAAWRWNRWVGAALLVVATTTNTLNWGALEAGTRLRSIQLAFVRELASPPPDPYTPAIAWLRRHVPEGATVGVEPEHMRYPLMFHAPHAAYTWQIDPAQRPRLPGIDPRQFKGFEPPKYFVTFGLRDQELAPIERQAGRRYIERGRIATYWKDQYRPEINLRSFEENRYFTPNESVFLWELEPAN